MFRKQSERQVCSPDLALERKRDLGEGAKGEAAETWRTPNFSHRFIMKNCKHAEKFKELYSEHPHTHHLESIIIIFLYLLYHTSIHPSEHQQPILFCMCFRVSLTSQHFAPAHKLRVISQSSAARETRRPYVYCSVSESLCAPRVRVQVQNIPITPEVPCAPYSQLLLPPHSQRQPLFLFFFHHRLFLSENM